MSREHYRLHSYDLDKIVLIFSGIVLLQWRHNECHCFLNHRHLDCLLSRLLRRTSKKILKIRVTGLFEGNPPVTGAFPSQRASSVNIFFQLMTSSCINPLTLTLIRGSLLSGLLFWLIYLPRVGQRKNKWYQNASTHEVIFTNIFNLFAPGRSGSQFKCVQVELSRTFTYNDIRF